MADVASRQQWDDSSLSAQEDENPSPSLLRIPELYCPLAVALHPAVERAEAHNEDWVLDFGLVQNDAAIKRFRRARFAWLIARCYPGTDAEMLNLLLDFNTWLFILDDVHDEGEVTDLGHLRRVHASFLAVLRNQWDAPAGDPFASSLADIWERLSRLSPLGTPAWKDRFIQDMADYFEGCEWEGSNRLFRRVPSLRDYVSYRALTGAVQADLDLGELSERVSLADAVREHAGVRALAQACSDIVCWANDIYSCSKELKAGDVHNLVIVLAYERDLSWQEALERAALMHNDRMRQFLDLEQGLKRQAWFDENLARYVGVMCVHGSPVTCVGRRKVGATINSSLWSKRLQSNV